MYLTSFLARCWHCNKRGHVRNECWQVIGNKYSDGSEGGEGSSRGRGRGRGRGTSRGGGRGLGGGYKRGSGRGWGIGRGRARGNGKSIFFDVGGGGISKYLYVVGFI